MVYGDLQFFDIIIFAGIAAFLIYRLRKVLGKRSGYQPDNFLNKNDTDEDKAPKKNTPSLKENEEKLKIIYDKVEDFDHKYFIEGAKKAFEIIITAYHNSDKKTLKDLVSKDVYSAFEKSIDDKTNDPNYQFYSLTVESVENAIIENNTMKITLRFISEQLKDNDENSITKKQDTWTFEKKINSKNPAWLLVAT